MKIALIGKMRSGKDTVADYLINNYNFTRFAFGDELKRYYHLIFGETKVKPREGYQWFGQTMRQHKPDIWVDKCFETVNKQETSFMKAMGYDGLKPIITDLRQPNEYKRCVDEGYKIVKVFCDDETRIKRILEKNDSFNKKDLYHETEMHIDTYKYDYLINNVGDLDELYSQINMLMKEVAN